MCGMEQSHLERIRASITGLREADASLDPFQQFGTWLDQAREAELPEPTAMTLSTATPRARPSSRTVLLKSFDEHGFVFYTNYTSRKARELQENPHASLLFHWTELERQVRIEGEVHRVSRDESEAYFHSRPLGSQVGAWASRQSAVIPDRETLEQWVSEAEQRFGEGPVPLPEFWGGYRVVPAAIEFWQGGQYRLHDRLRYTKSGEAWKIERLSP
jgi:pyridoxamine 5'-phosphate oxidase